MAHPPSDDGGSQARVSASPNGPESNRRWGVSRPGQPRCSPEYRAVGQVDGAASTNSIVSAAIGRRAMGQGAVRG